MIMNKQSLLNKIQQYYGETCLLCKVNQADEIYPIVSHKVLRGARQMNRKSNRKSCKTLPAFNTYHEENILPVCKQCYCKAINGNIFQILNTVQMCYIDSIRQSLGFIELSQVNSQRDFRYKLFHKITLSKKER